MVENSKIHTTRSTKQWSEVNTSQVYDYEDNLIVIIILLQRFFDLRVAWNEKEQKIYYVHGLYSEEITESFDELYTFLQEHPGEFVIIDFQHFYNFDTPHHQLLIDHLMKFFHSMIFQNDSRAYHLPHLTLNRANSTGKQLIVTYRSCYSSPIFFTSRDFPTPWPNSTSVDYLKEFLDEQLKTRSPEQGWITQCVITPDANYIIPRFYSSLKKSCAKKVLIEMEDFIRSKEPGRWKSGEMPKINIILGDFVDMEDNRFCKMVIDLNMKLMIVQ